MMEESTKAELAEAEITKKATESILNVAKAEAEELGAQINEYRAVVEALSSEPAEGAAEGAPGGPPPQLIAELLSRLEALENRPEPARAAEEDIRVERDRDGLITSVGGRTVRRDERGLLAGLS